jgi:hypothetical protein
MDVAAPEAGKTSKAKALKSIISREEREAGSRPFARKAHLCRAKSATFRSQT